MNASLMFFAALLGFTSPVSANTWNEIEAGTVLRLKQNLEILPSLVLPKGAHVAVNSIDFFGPPYLASYGLKLFPCPESIAERRIDMVILDNAYGIELDWNCRISLFLEVRDFYRESYFEKIN
ncbi:MAG: hypothetical protein KGP28_04410 [Bdellovibrionales bacterium]|nr:hypothetical protein [Bdellovibrionales bacterium]